MRTIKFRGKRLDNQGWAYGYYAMWQNDSTIFPSSSIGKPYKVDKSTVGQFTGLHDKNGKEIYEGDVCKWSSWFLGSYQEINGDKIISLVEWSNKKGKWFVKNDIWDLGIYSDIEIIGNIYENPELL